MFMAPSFDFYYEPDQVHDPKPKLSREEKKELILRLRENWEKVVGVELARITEPKVFKGKKSRLLLVQYKPGSYRPPWGSWWYIRENINERYHFRHLRKAINEAIAPHEVDHIDFTEQAQNNKVEIDFLSRSP